MKNPKLRTTIFWSAIFSSALLLIQAVSAILGYTLDTEISLQLLGSVNAVVASLALGGILVDPGKVDSFQAIKKNNKED